MFRFIGAALRQLAAASQPPREESMTPLESPEDLAACVARSHETPVFLLKHSTRCPISSQALQEVRDYVDEAGDEGLPVYINYVVEARPISTQIAAELGVQHESPQLLMLRGGAVEWHTSHGGIRREAMFAVVDKTE